MSLPLFKPVEDITHKFMSNQINQLPMLMKTKLKSCYRPILANQYYNVSVGSLNEVFNSGVVHLVMSSQI